MVRALVEERCELYVGIANSKYDISGCGGAFVMIPGPLNSRLRALSVDITTLILGLIPVMLMACEFAMVNWCTGTWMRRKNK